MTLSVEQIWQTTLGQLQLQMTGVIFDAHLAETRLLELDEGQAVIATPSPFSREWLENRLAGTIGRTVAAVLGRPVDLQFVVDHQAESSPPLQEPEPEIELPSFAEQLAQADYYAAHFTAGGSGYAMLSHYENTFWMPYLESQVSGTWSLYLRLAGQKRATVKNMADRWTDPCRYTYRELANWLNLSHQRSVSGYICECYQSRRAIRESGQALEICCNQHYPTACRQDREKRIRCVHWKTGMLEILHEEHLAAIEEHKATSQRIRAHLLNIQVWRLLPVLTPSQAARLNPDLQKIHYQWLLDFGHLLGLEQPADWEQITEDTLVPLMSGYQEYRKLTGPYRPDSKFLSLLRRARLNLSQNANSRGKNAPFEAEKEPENRD